MTVTRGERVYRRLLRLLPGPFRAEAEAELLDTFGRLQARAAAAGWRARATFWCRIAADLILTCWAERRAEHWARRHVARPSMRHSRRDLMSPIHDLRLSFRLLVHHRGFAITALLTLSLGIGAAITMFSVVNAVLLRPLPYPDPDRLVIVWQELRARGVQEFPFPPGDIPDLRDRGTNLESVAVLQTGRATTTNADGLPEQVRMALVTPNLFDVLGFSVVHGRRFQVADGTPLPPAAAGAPPPVAPPPVAVLSYEYWRRRYGGDPAIVGRFVPLNGGEAEVIGVTEPNAELLFPPRNNIERTPDLWIASRTDFANGTRTAGVVRVLARMKSGVSIEQTQAQMEALAADLRATYPVKENAGVYINAVPMHGTLVSDVRVAVLALMAAVMLVLLIASVNVANLLVTQSLRREREFAVRAALGAGRSSLVRFVIAECVVLAGLAAAAGLGLAQLGIAALQQIGPSTLPRLDQVAIDPRVVVFAAATALLAVFIVGLPPALRVSRPDLAGILQRAGRHAGLGTGRVRHGLVIAEVAMTFVLLIGAGLMFRSAVALQRVDPGLDPHGLLTFRLSGPPAPSLEARVSESQGLQEALMALAGVTSVSAARPLPLDGGRANMPWGIAGMDAAEFLQANVHTVLPGYFETMRTPILEGRTYTRDDQTSGADVVIVDEMLAAKAYPGQSAIGRPLLLRIGGNDPTPFEVIGVVAHQRHATLAEDGREALFFVDGVQGRANRWAVRLSGDPLSRTADVRRAIAQFDDRMAVSEIQPMTAFVDQAQAQTRFALWLIGLFAVIAATLSVVGLYGVLSALVRQRTAEIGVRMAFGAGRGTIFRLIVGRGLLLSGAGIGAGVLGALGLSTVIRSLLVGVESTDPVTFVGASLLFLLVALVASGLPAIRAARLDPVTALRGQ